jgi:plasmid stabilization system protein ParE
MTKVDVLATARDEFREAFHWYRDRSAQVGRRYALEVKSAIAAIRQHPEQHAKWGDEYRFRLLDRFPYYVAYRYTSDLVVIVAIRHAAQDQDAWQGR